METLKPWQVLGWALCLQLAACSNTPEVRREPGAPQDLSTRATSLEYPAAYWKQSGDRGSAREVSRSRIDSLMIEMTGRLALQEALLDEILADTLQREGMELTADAVERERSLMMEVLSADETEGYRLLEEIRVREGLGPVRFAALLRRNAMLRTLIEEQVELREEAILAAWDTLHGPRRIARVVVSPNLAEAREASEAVRQGRAFTEIAAGRSTDASARAGGLLQPVSRLDPSWPTAFRETLWSLEPGVVSEPVLVDGDYLLIKYLEEVPGDDISFEEGRQEALGSLRRAQERILMDAEARKLLDRVEVEVIDGELNRAWNQNLTPIRIPDLPSSRMKSE